MEFDLGSILAIACCAIFAGVVVGAEIHSRKQRNRDQPKGMASVDTRRQPAHSDRPESRD